MRLIRPSYQILTPIDNKDILTRLEQAARICYKSEDRITEDSAQKLCKMLIDNKHESVLEHVSLSIKFIVDRGVSHELVRHRILSVSQESTRYCNYKKKGLVFITPLHLNLQPGSYTYSCQHELNCGQSRLYYKDCEIVSHLTLEQQDFLDYLFYVEKFYNDCIKNGQAPQEARCILPNCLKTEIIISANLREMRHILRLRTHKTAHPEMRQVMCQLLKELKEKISIIFDDIEEPV
jgi:thymidylate synthase (FAD)